MSPSFHTFQPAPDRPRECTICGRYKAPHAPEAVGMRSDARDGSESH